MFAATEPFDEEKKISLKDLPERVRESVMRVSKNTTISEIVQEDEDGKTVYEVELILDNVEIEVEFDSKGNILDVEIERQGGSNAGGKNGDDDDDDDDDDDG